MTNPLLQDLSEVVKLQREYDTAKGYEAEEAASVREDMAASNFLRTHHVAIEAAIAERDALRARIEGAPVALMDTRDALGICAPSEEDFPALYALQGKRVRLVVEGE